MMVKGLVNKDALSYKYVMVSMVWLDCERL